jgi:NADH:ubiquinone oxidoreductase subunit 3 (subunit A)
METVLFSPPVLFIAAFFLFAGTSKFLSRYANKSDIGEHGLDSYACGQRNVPNYVNPDYSQFFIYAFVFTVAHILILVVATAPIKANSVPITYIVAGMLALLIALKR